MRRLGDSMGKSLCISSLLTALLLIPGMVGAQTFKGVASPGAEVSAKTLPVSKARRGISLTVRSTPMTDEKGRPVGNRQQIFVSAPPRSRTLNPHFLAPPFSDGFPAGFTDAFKLRPHLTPVDTDEGNGGVANFLGCAGTADVTVLANEITFGAGGPQVPTHVKYQVGENSPVTLFNGENASEHIGLPEQITLQAGEEISLWGHSAYPDFNDPYQLNIEKRSDDAQMAAILTDGEVLADVMASKGAATIPFGMQQSLETILGPMMENGMLVLEEDEMIILFELGATNSSSPAFDFNDLVLHVRTQCPNNTEVVLRDSIGPDILMTNGNNTIDTTSAGTGHQYIGTSLTPQVNMHLKKVSMVIGSSYGSTPSINWSAYIFKINVWSSAAARSAAPLLGDVVRCVYDQPANASSSSTPPPTFGQSWSILGTLTNSFLAEFDLVNGPGGSCTVYNPLIAGNNYVFAIAPARISTGSPGNMSAVESTQTQPNVSDTYYGNSIPGGEMPFSSHSRSQYAGRVGYKVVGVAQ